MKYIDSVGDIWEDSEEDYLRVVSARRPGDVGVEFTRTDAEAMYGPLRPLKEDSDDAQDAPSQPLPTVEGVMSRASVFQSAHALVTGLPWGDEEKPSVYDVLSVAKWLEGDE